MTGLPKFTTHGKLVELIELINLIDNITLIDRITLIDTITDITNIGTLAAITNIVNLETLELVDKITLIDAITSIGTINEITTITSIKDSPALRPMTSRERTGIPFFVDTFKDYYESVTEVWEQLFGTIALDTDRWAIDGTCMKLTTSAVIDSWAAARLNRGLFKQGRFGIEYEFQSESGNDWLKAILISISVYDGTNEKLGYAKYLTNTGVLKWQYFNSDGNWADIPSGTQYLFLDAGTVQPFWHNMKLIIDFTENKYVKLICNNVEFDLSEFALDVNADAVTEPKVEVRISVQTAIAGARELRVDGVIVTKNEP